MSNKDNKEFLLANIHELDAPECLVPEINAFKCEWPEKDASKVTKICLIAPVPYSAMVANMGLSILYDFMNSSVENVICERFYFPESKLLGRIKKAGKLFFSKESCHNLNEFDIMAFSSYFPLQLLAVPEILEASGVGVFTDKRNDWEPLVIMGGISAFNPEPIYNMLDLVCVGEGEEMLPFLTKIVKEEKGKGIGWKVRVKERAVKESNGIGWYCPEYYEEEYFPADHQTHANQIKGRKILKDFAPAMVTKATIDLKKHKPLTRMIVSNSEGQEMSAGSLMIATGCSNRCIFCQGSFTTAPYRERDFEAVKKGFEDLIENTGAVACTPYSFNLSDFSCINSLVKFLLEDENRKVSMSSQRIDYFNEDFAAVARFSGNRSITLAIEAGGQRMRNIVNKNLSEEQILIAFRTAFKVGFTGIKVYMIANLPFENDEDRFAIVHLMEKINAIREEIGANTKIRISYTPFCAKNFTPFQWAKCWACDATTNLPIFEKNLGNVIDGVHKFGIKFRVGTHSDLSAINQVLTLGDRRLAKVIYEIYKNSSLKYRGGMSVGKNPLIEFQRILRTIGLDYPYFFREKGEEEIFAWDFINAGITKDFLSRAWNLAKWNNEATVEKGNLPKVVPNFLKKEKGLVQSLPPCWVKCTNCGCCGKDSKIVHINMPNHEPDIKNISDSLVLEKKNIKYCGIARIYVYDSYRWVHVSKLKMQLRRAALKEGLSILNEFSLTSDKIVWQNWTSGIEFAEVLLFARPERSTDQLIKDLNKHLWSMEILDLNIFKTSTKTLSKVFDSVYYRIVILDSGVVENLKAQAERYDKAEKFIIKMKVKGLQRGVFEIVERDLKADRVSSIWLEEPFEFEKGLVVVCMKLMSDISAYDVLPYLLGIAKRRTLKFPARKVAYFQSRMDAELDMFAQCCIECGAEVEKDLLDNFITSTHCVKHARKANEKELDNLRYLSKIRGIEDSELSVKV